MPSLCCLHTGWNLKVREDVRCREYAINRFVLLDLRCTTTFKEFAELCGTSDSSYRTRCSLALSST